MSSHAKPQHLFATMLACVQAATTAVLGSGADVSRIVVEPPRDPTHGDMATNAAMVLAKDAGKKPRELAESIAAKLRSDGKVASADVAGPGFINLTLKANVWCEELRLVLEAGRDYGRSDMAKAIRSMSNMCRPIPRGPCMWVTAAARCLETRWQTCLPLPATRSRASTTSTMPARRSTYSHARHICATARRSGNTSPSRKASIPANISSRLARISRKRTDHR